MILAQILIFVNICLYRHKNGKEMKYLNGYVQAMSFWMLFCFLLVEMLSVFQGINRLSLSVAWGGMDMLLIGVMLTQIFNNREATMKDIRKGFRVENPWYRKENLILVMISLIVLVLAVKTAPYNWDSMTYRLARVAYWTQNGSVQHYANNSLRLIANPPLGEFVHLNLYVLHERSDNMLNLLQCTSYITCTVLVYHIAKKICCERFFCFLAALLFQSMPIAFSEAVNTQVDLFSTVWLLGFVYLLLDFALEEREIIWSAENGVKVFTLGLCVAWGYLAKPSVCIAMAIFCIWLLITCIVRKDRFANLIRLLGCALTGMLITFPWEIIRNIRSFHAIASPLAGARQLVGTLNPVYLLVNFVKNFVHNLPCVYLGQGRDFLETFTRRLAALLKVDINAASIAEDGAGYGLRPLQDYGHDTAINPIIVWLFVICVVWSIIKIRQTEWKTLYKSYSLIAAVSFLSFCVVLRWEMYVTRYMLSFLALLCPMIAYQLQKRTENKVGLRTAILGAICCLCLLEVGNLTIYHRNVCVRQGAGSKPYGYFANRGNEYNTYLCVVQMIQDRGYQNVGLRLGGDDYEYPYWVLLGDAVTHIEHVDVSNESAVYIDEDFQPQCIIWHGAAPTDVFVWNGQAYPEITEIAENRYVLTAER